MSARIPGIPTGRIACCVELPGIRSLAAAILMLDGTWEIDPSLCTADRRSVTRWITAYGDAFREEHRDLLDRTNHG